MRYIRTLISLIIIAICAAVISAGGDPRQPTISLSYSTMLGGSGVDDCDGVAVNGSGAVYLGCHSDSPNLPRGSSPGYSIKGDLDAFVMKLAPDGRRVAHLTQLGGSAWEAVQDVAVDSRGFAYVVGSTYSPDLPTTAGASRRSYGGGEGDAFVAKLDRSGAVVYATYLGGNRLDDGRRIVVDGAGNAYIVGRTESPDFPTTTGARQRAKADNTDVFVVKLNPAGKLEYSTFLGGSGDDIAWGVAIDRARRVYVAGQTTSLDFPLARPLQDRIRGEGDCFVAALDLRSGELFFSTYWGGSAWDQANAIDIDSAGSIYLTGWVHSSDFPVTAGALQATYGGNHDAFVTRLSPMGRAVLYSTYVGGDRDDSGAQVIAGPAGQAWLVGGTESANFPVANPFQTALRGTKDGFVTLLNAAGSAVLYSTYLGGSDRELFEDAAAAPGGALIVSGLTRSTDFPTIAPLHSTHGGGVYDIVVAKFALRPR